MVDVGEHRAGRAPQRCGERPGRGAQALGLAARGGGGRAAGRLVRGRDRARGGHQAGGGVGGERGREVLDAAALGADPGQQEDRPRHELAHARDVLGRGGADDGADVVQAGRLRRRLRRARRRPPRRAPTAARRPRARGPRRRRRRGWTCGRARTSPRAAARAASTSTSSVSTPRYGLAVNASTPQAGDVAERRRRGADQRLAVGRRRHGDVAALAVGEDEQARPRGACSTTSVSAAHPGAPRRSKQASCGLTATQAGPAASISARQCATTAAAARSAGVPPVGHRSQRLRPQARGVGIEPEDDLRLAVGDHRGQAVGEVRPRRRRARRRTAGDPPVVVFGRGGNRAARGVGTMLSAPLVGGGRAHGRARRCLVSRSAVDGLLQARAGGEARHLRRGDLDRLARAGVHALASTAVGDVELAEPGERHVAAALEGLLDDFENGIDGLAGLVLAQVGPARDLVDEL